MDLLTKARLDGIVSSMSLLLHNSGKYRIEVLGISSQADSSKCTCTVQRGASDHSQGFKDKNLGRSPGLLRL